MANKSNATVRGLKVGDLVQVTGSSSWMTPEPVTIVEFGIKDRSDELGGQVEETASLSDGQWAYVNELRKVSR